MIWPFKQRVRCIETRGCMAHDGDVASGVVIGEVTRTVYDGQPGGVDVQFYIIRLEDGSTVERAVQDGYKAPDGVLEFRR